MFPLKNLARKGLSCMNMYIVDVYSYRCIMLSWLAGEAFIGSHGVYLI